jgi:hypothetical protein
LSAHANKGRTTVGLSLLVTLAMTAMMLLFSGGSTATSATASHGAGAGTSSFTRVAHNPQGFAKSMIVGQTAKGKRVTGYFTPLGFSKHNGHLRARGLVNGVVHNSNGTTRTFTVIRTFRVKTMNGTVPGPGARTGAGAAGSCDILHLVLGPLDLDLLGLQVHLDKVVLNIVAQSGSGQLLGNLLCAVAHLLDNNGTLGQLLTQLQNILNQLLMGL